MLGPLLLRADASFNIGTGHVMRLIALAQAWRQLVGNHAAIFLLGCVTPAQLRMRLSTVGIELRDLSAAYPDGADLETFSNLVATVQPTWIVLDGYHFDPVYQAAVHAWGIPVLVVDDMAHHGQYHAHLLLNQNVAAKELLYTVATDTRLLLGPRYCLMRSELQAARNTLITAHQTHPRRLLITMGGADPHGLSSLALTAVALLDTHWEVKVVVGSATPHVDELRQQVAALPLVELHTDVLNMGTLMTWADVALAAAGTTTWELAYLGVPSLLVVAADNQIAVAQMAAAVGCALNLGWWEQLTAMKLAHALTQLADNESQRSLMKNAGPDLIDGQGARRVVQVLLEYTQENCVAG